MVSPARIDYEAIGEAVERELLPDDLLSNAARFLSRPGWAARSLLQGDPEGAARNLAQLALDLPTGGFLSRKLSLANLVNDRGDLTSAKQRPEFSDVTRSWGLGAPGPGAGRFALDVIGGLATDPLTYLTLGGGGLARGAIGGLTREATASTLAGALRQTARGRAVLQGIGRGDDLAAGLERALGIPGGRLGATTSAAEEAALLRQLEQTRHVLDRGALRFGETPLVRDVWPKIGSATLPGLAYRGLQKASPEAAERLAGATRKAWEYVTRNFYDRKLAGGVPEGMRRAAQEMGVEQNARSLAGERVAQGVAASTPEEIRRQVLPRLWAASDEWQAQAWGRSTAERKALRERLEAKLVEGLPPEGVAALQAWRSMARESERELVARGGLKRPIEELEAFADPIEGVSVSDLTAAQHNARATSRADALEAVGPDLRAKIRRAGFDVLIDDPFYAPRQLKDEVAQGLPRARSLFQASRGAKSVFLKRRQFGSAEEMAAAMREAIARDAAEGALREGADLTPEAIAAGAAEAAAARGIDDVLETDLAKVMLRYSDQTAARLARLGLEKEAKRIGARYGDAAGPLDEYVKEVTASVEGRGAARRLLAKVNGYYKPALTTMFPAFHARNATSGVVQAALDPDLGLMEGSKAMLTLLRNAPALTLGKRLGLERDQALTIMQAAGGDAAARTAVEGMQIGRLKGKEFLRYLDGAIAGRGAGSADLFESTAMLERLRMTPERSRANPARWLSTWNRWMLAVGNNVENSFRTHAFMRLLEKGVDPADAVRRVNRAYVDYSANSVAEKIARDVFPFLRYSLGITPTVVEELARRPGAPVHQLLRTAKSEAERDEDAALLPEHLQRQVTLPLGEGSYLTSLGLPHEAAGALLGAVPRPSGLQEGLDFAGTRNFLGGVSPPLRAPLEATFGRTLFGGREFAGDRRAGDVLGALPVSEPLTLRGGREVRELPGWVNELINASPGARFASTLNALVKEDDSRSTADRVLRSGLGFDRVTLDQRKAALQVISRYFEKMVKRGQLVAVRRYWPRVEKGDLPDDLRELLEQEDALRKAKPKD